MIPFRPLAWPVQVAVLAAVASVALVATPTPAPEVSPEVAPAPAPAAARLPQDLAFTESGIEVEDRHLFNDFSWRQFIALNWPAIKTKRGEPDTSQPFGAPKGAVVWGTWKSLDELFPPDPVKNPPTPWDSFDAELTALRPKKGVVKEAGKEKILSQTVALGAVNQGGFSAGPAPPLIAQNRTYVRYEVRVNETAYEFIRKNRFYLSEVIDQAVAKEKGPIPFPDGSVVVKAAWMELTGVANPERFYQVSARIDDSPGETLDAKLREVSVGLVGLHIAQKTHRKPSWVWTTFEHVDNTEPGPGGSSASFSTNDPAVIHTSNNVNYVPDAHANDQPLPRNPVPVDVQRANAVHPTTHNVNLSRHRSAEVKNTVWRNYRLVATQWVTATDPGDPARISEFITATPPRVLPVGGVANTTMETYRQAESCLICHRTAKKDFGFIFFPSLRAYQRP